MIVERISPATPASSARPAKDPGSDPVRVPRQSRLFMVAVFTVVLFTALGAFAGYSVGARDVSVETVIHSWQKSEAQLYFAGLTGDFAEESTITLSIDMGSNRIRFPIKGPDQRMSVVQRFDPCACNGGIAVGRIGLRSPFAHEPYGVERWEPAGSIQGFVPDATMVTLLNGNAEIDPQILLYLDIKTFVERSAATGAFLGGAVALLAASTTLFVTQRLRRRSHAGVNSGLGSRRRASHTLGPWVTGFAIVFTSLGIGQAAAGAIATGVTIDEGYHVEHLQNYLDGGNYSSASYGPAAALVGHAVNIALGNEVFGTVSSNPAAFTGRHLGVALTGILAILAVGVATGVLLRSWNWGFVGAAVLASIPLWIGHSMFNIKDIPAGSGYAAFLTGLVLAISPVLRPWLRAALSVLSIAIGVLLGIGTRPGLWPLFVVSAVVALLVWGLSRMLSGEGAGARKRRVVSLTVVGGLVGVAGAVLSVLFFTEIGRELSEAVTRSLDHPWSKSRRYAGLRVFNRPDAGLVFQILLSQLPSAISVLFLLGAGVALWMFLRALFRGGLESPRTHVFPLWGIPVFAPFIVIAIFSPVSYDGIRQILFIIPGVAVFATFGMWSLVQFLLRVFDSRKTAKNVGAIGIVVILSLIAVDQVRLFPYNYTYLNEVAQGPGLSGAWETDYWDSSFREAIEGKVVAGDPIMCGHTHTLYPNLDSLRPLCIAAVPFVEDLEGNGPSLLGEREFWTVRSERELLHYGPPPPNCQPHSAVTRQLRLEPVVMSRLYVCTDN